MLGKLKNLLQKDGVGGTARKLGRFVRYELEARLLPPGEELETLLALIRGGAYERLVLRRGSFGYHTPLFQRSQQLALALSRRGCLVLYEAAPPHERVIGAERITDGLWLVNFRSRRVRRALEQAAEQSGRPRYLLITSPECRIEASLPGAYARRGYTVIYDYIDALSGEISGTKRVPRSCAALYRFAMRNPQTLILASSLALLRDARTHKRKEDVLLVENGVDCAHFSVPGDCPEDEAFRALLARGRPIVCYYGALARWLDYASLRCIAHDGRFSLLLIGVKYDASYDAELAGCENVCFLGPKPYARLKDYAARCDVMLVPFLPGEVGDAASPVKLFEYLALGKPVVASATAECRRCRSALIARSAEEYIRCIEQALVLRDCRIYRLRALAEAQKADWLCRADCLRAELLRREGAGDKAKENMQNFTFF